MTVFNGTSIDDTKTFGKSNDRMYGNGGDDDLDGGAGNDFIDGGTGNNILIGGLGNDTIRSLRPDVIDGGKGDDIAELDRKQSASGVALTLLGPDAETWLSDDTLLTGIERIKFLGSNFVDMVTAGTGKDTLYGYAGDDYLNGGAGDDYLVGGQGNDTLLGGDGNDSISAYESGFDVIDGGSGDDRVAIDRSLSNVGFNFTVGAPTSITALGDGTTVTGIEHFYFLGSDSSADTLTGGDNGDTFIGNGGNDVLHGGKGNDQLRGGAGNDVLDGGEGNDALSDMWFSNESEGGSDTILGGAGNDSILSYDGINADFLDGGEGKDTLFIDRIYSATGFTFTMGAPDTTTVMQDGTSLTGFEVLYFYGSDLASDTLSGSAGKDHLYGNGGDDVLSGGGRRDSLWGGEGNDILTGGAGSDGFYFDNYDGGDKDRITDFDAVGKVHDILGLIGLNLDDVEPTKLKKKYFDQVRDDVVIDIPGRIKLVLEDVRLRDLDVGDFQY